MGVYSIKHRKANHHYVPQFILRNFKIAPNKGMVHEYTAKNYNGKIKSIKKQVCLIPNLYTFKDKKTQSKNDFIEDELFSNLIEEYTPEIIEQILVPGFTITSLEESILSTFVAFQYVRTPRFLSQLNRYIVYLVQRKGLTIEDIADKNNHKDFLRKAFIENAYAVTRKDFESFQTSNNLYMSGAQNLLITMAIQIGLYISQPLYQKKHMIMIKDDMESVFMTDHPVTIVNPKTGEYMYQMLWELDSMIVYMPLSPTRAIYFHPDGVEFPGLDFLYIASLLDSNGKAYSDKENEELKDFFKQMASKAPPIPNKQSNHGAPSWENPSKPV
jgi:hypothetical protein